MKKIDDDLFNKLTSQHLGASSKQDFGKEVLETMSYSEVKELLLPLLEARIGIKAALEKKYKQLLRITKKYHAPSTFEYDFCVDAVWLMHGANNDIQNQSELNSLESYYIWNESRKPKPHHQSSSSWQDNQQLIQTAKQIPLESLYKNPLRRSGSNRLVGLCPFHQERRSSFTIFTNSNTFYCFGCATKGDSISFYQKLYGVPFWEAVKQMTGSY